MTSTHRSSKPIRIAGTAAILIAGTTAYLVLLVLSNSLWSSPSPLSRDKGEGTLGAVLPGGAPGEPPCVMWTRRPQTPVHYPAPPKVPFLRLIRHVRPVYPEAALASRAKGVVVVQFTVNCAGAVVDPVVVGSDPTFDQAALEAVRQWRYAPTVVDGVVRAERIEIPVVVPPPPEPLTR